MAEDPMLSPTEKKRKGKKRKEKKIRLASQNHTVRISDCLSSKHGKSESFEARGKRLPILPQGRPMIMRLAQSES